jgi:hypothetical protein
MNRESHELPDTSAWVAKLGPRFDSVLARHSALPPRKRYEVSRDLGLLIAHMAHLSVVGLRLSDIAGRPRANKAFANAIVLATAQSSRVAELAKSVSSQLSATARRFQRGDLLTEAEIAALVISIEAVTPATGAAEAGSGKRKARTSASLLTTRSTRRTPASRGLQGKPRATGRAR